MFKPENDDNAIAAMAGLPQQKELSKEDRDRRDMFAAAALSGELARIKWCSNEGSGLAVRCFNFADEMMKASKKE